MKKMMIALMAVLITVALAGIGTYAYFSDTETSDVTSLKAGTLTLNEGLSGGVDLGTIGNMAPGDKTGNAVVYITNTGTIPLGWFGDLVISGRDGLENAIYIDDAKMEFLGGSWSEPTDNFIVAGVGSGPYPGWYNTLAGMSTFGVITLNNFDGNNGMGSAPYEFMGALNPGFAYRLTLRFGFAALANNAYQGLGPLNVSFRADATQVNEAAIQLLVPTFAPTVAASHALWMNGQLANQLP